MIRVIGFLVSLMLLVVSVAYLILPLGFVAVLGMLGFAFFTPICAMSEEEKAAVRRRVRQHARHEDDCFPTDVFLPADDEFYGYVRTDDEK